MQENKEEIKRGKQRERKKKRIQFQSVFTSRHVVRNDVIMVLAITQISALFGIFF